MTHAGLLAAPPAPRARAGRMPLVVPACLALGGVLAQISYPLLSGEPLRFVTIAAVVLLAAAAVTHAAFSWGRGAAVRLLVTAAGTGWAAEALGVATGFPFGSYDYTGTLGPEVLGVPVVVPLAWTMLGYPCLLLGRRLAAGTRPRASGTGARTRLARPAAVALIGGTALATWDLFLDPQMVAEGHWAWRFPDPALPGVPGVPLTNYAGWLLVGVLLIAALDRVLPRRAAAAEAVPAGVLAWTWAGSALANAAFFGRPWVALYGGLAMGALVLPYLLALRRAHR